MKIVVDWSIVCQHLLWEEPISAENRTAYKTYFETINPQALVKYKEPELKPQDPKLYHEALVEVVDSDMKEMAVSEI